jgi:hypothetical protein
MTDIPAPQPDPHQATASQTKAEAAKAVTAKVGPPSYRRHPLGLPEGSIRALLALFILGNIWVILLLPQGSGHAVPLYLYYLMFLIIGHYFGLRGNAPSLAGTGEWPPLYLPRGSIRLIILTGFVGVFAWNWYSSGDFINRLEPKAITQSGHLMLIILGMFFLGILVARFRNFLFRGPQGVRPWYQDLQSWISLLAIIFLTIVLVWEFIISPGLRPEYHYVVPPELQVVLTSIVAFYFGVRS